MFGVIIDFLKYFPFFLWYFLSFFSNNTGANKQNYNIKKRVKNIYNIYIKKVFECPEIYVFGALKKISNGASDEHWPYIWIGHV